MSDVKKELLARLGRAGCLFVLMSGCTREPYVECDEKTFDDKVFLYLTEEEAKEHEEQFGENKIPVSVARLERQQMALFFTNLYTMGVNALELVSEGVHELIQLEDFVRRRDTSQLPDGTRWVENPQLHLTALYFAQELRKPADPGTKDRLLELQEELTADFKKGSFLFALEKEGKGTPMVKMKDGQKYQPVFTDALEFSRFNQEKQFKAVAVEADQLLQVLDKEAKGVILNIVGVNLPFSVNR